ncbi:MAG: hypothetical protein JW852_08350 [Spirochaetales bacterium]|nr:hypothetical protein [Spirochaetales bacterium]
MDKDDIMFKLQGYLADKNYIAACLYLKNEEIPDDAKYEITGEVAARVIDDLAAEKNKEKILYLRSILVWLFREVPGLASVYREQLRLASGGQGMMRDFLRGVRTFADVASGGATESVQEKAEEAAENLRPEVIQEKVKDFFSHAGVDIDDGIKRAQEFFDNLAGRRETKPGNDADDE